MRSSRYCRQLNIRCAACGERSYGCACILNWNHAIGVAVKEMGALEYDPASGVYRPAKRG